MAAVRGIRRLSGLCGLGAGRVGVAGEAATVIRRGHADDATEVVPQQRRGAEARAVGDLVDDVATNKVAFDSLAPSALPEPMQAMSAADRGRYLETKKKERQEVLRQIGELNSKRDAYLKSKPAAPATSFDGKVRESLKKQAAAVDLLLE